MAWGHITRWFTRQVKKMIIIIRYDYLTNRSIDENRGAIFKIDVFPHFVDGKLEEEKFVFR